MAMDLPDELWQQIFDLAADEDVIFSYGLPTNMAECAWYKNAFGEWALRTPQEAINAIQRRSYATKKAIMKTCKTWRRVGSETLFRCLFFSNASKLHLLSQHLKSFPSPSSPASSPGWWTKRLHLARYNASANSHSSITEQDLSSSLSTILSHTPNLQILIIELPLSTNIFSAFGPYLRTRSSTRPPSSFSPQTSPGHPLHTLSLHLSFESLPKLIWALDSLPNLVSLHVTFDPPSAETLEEEEVKLGSAGGLELDLKRLQQLSLKGACGVFLDEANGWGMANLRALQIDLGSMRNPNPSPNPNPNGDNPNKTVSDAGTYPDLIAFLESPLPSSTPDTNETTSSKSSQVLPTHGLKLLYLDINSIPPMDIPRILDACPRLETFCFNADWRMDPVPNFLGGAGVSSITSLAMAMDSTPPTRLTITPHQSIKTIGLHGLSYAFGVGYAAAYAEVEPLRAGRVCLSNDANFLALGGGGGGSGRQLPELKSVRVLSRGLLRDLERAGGPDDGSSGKVREGTSNHATTPSNSINATSNALDALGLSGLGLNTFQFEYALGATPGGAGGGRGGGGGGGTGMQRWERWWDQCSRLGIRLEDCTGGPLGDLPEDNNDVSDYEEDEEGEEEELEDSEEDSWGEEDEDDEESEESEEEDPDAWPSWLPRPPPLPATPSGSAPSSPTKSPTKSLFRNVLGPGPGSPTRRGGGLLEPGSPTKRPSPLNPNAGSSNSRPGSPTKASGSLSSNNVASSSSSSSSTLPNTDQTGSKDEKQNNHTFQPNGAKLSKTNTRELRKLLEECKAMTESREDENGLGFGFPFGFSGIGMGMGMGGGMGGGIGGGMGGSMSPFGPNVGMAGSGGPGIPSFGTGGGDSASHGPFGRRRRGRESLEVEALGALAGLPPLGSPPDSPTRESRSEFPGGPSFGRGGAFGIGGRGGEESPTRKAVREIVGEREREKVGRGSFDSRIWNQGSIAGGSRQKPVFGVGGGLDSLGRGAGGYNMYAGEDEYEDDDEYESDEDEEEAEVAEMLGDLSIREGDLDGDEIKGEGS